MKSKLLVLSMLLVGMLQGCSMSSGVRIVSTEKEFTVMVAKDDLFFWNRTWPLTDEHYFVVNLDEETNTFYFNNTGDEDSQRVIVKNVYYEQYTETVPVLNYTVEYKEKVKTIDDIYDSTEYTSFKVVGAQPMSL